DLADALAHEPRYVDVRLGRDLAGDDHEAGRDQRLARDAAHRVVPEDGVEDGVRDLVGDLVRMALGDRLGCEGEGATGHGPQASRHRETPTIATGRGSASRTRGRSAGPAAPAAPSRRRGAGAAAPPRP